MLFDKASALLLANTGNLLQPFRPPTPDSQAPILAAKPEFSWDDLPANQTLVYHDCFDGYHCARLQVPMDWAADEGEDNRTVEIAVIRLAATVPVTDSTYGGAIVLNPGGPGGSGISLLLREGRYIQTIAGPAPDAENTTAKNFDIISFDPRGVNNTRPTFTCFPDYIERLTFELANSANAAFDSSDMAFTNYWTRTRALADSCSKRAIELGIGEHMTTPSVVRDIIEIFERHGEWREQEARRLLPSRQEVPAHVQYEPGKELIQYWGFSYGTVLGATLADMYPDRVGRVILDGVVDSFDYYTGGWSTNLQDTDLEIARFAEYCWMGGPKNCALYHEDGPAYIAQRFSDVMQKIRTEPIAVASDDKHGPELATFGDLKMYFWNTAYKPLTLFHKLAETMRQLELGNGTALVQERRDLKQKLKLGLSEECKKADPYSIKCDPSNAALDSMISAAILCSDAEDLTQMTKEEYWEYVQRLIGQSKLMGDVWAQIRVPCTQWHARPKHHHYTIAPNTTTTTSHPLLFIGNTIDNVTPLRNAHKMSACFSESIVLQQDSEGHCSSSGISLCTARHVRAYFQTGNLPEKGRVCGVERLPLDGFAEEKDPKMPEGEGDEELWAALLGLAGK